MTNALLNATVPTAMQGAYARIFRHALLPSEHEHDKHQHICHGLFLSRIQEGQGLPTRTFCSGNTRWVKTCCCFWRGWLYLHCYGRRRSGFMLCRRHVSLSGVLCAGPASPGICVQLAISTPAYTAWLPSLSLKCRFKVELGHSRMLQCNTSACMFTCHDLLAMHCVQ